MDSVKLLKDLWESGTITKQWIPCIDRGGAQTGKKPIIVCSSRCNNADRCRTFLEYEDAIDLLRDAVIAQDNPALESTFHSFLDKINLSEDRDRNQLMIVSESQPDTERETEGETEKPETETEPKTKGETEPETESEGETDKRAVQKKSVKKKAVKKKAVKKKAVKKKAVKKKAVIEEAAKNETIREFESTTTDRYAILPIHIEDVETRGFVTRDQLEDLTKKLDEEGIEYSVFKIGKDINKKSNYDYLVVPNSEDTPRIIKREELQENIEDFIENNIQVRIFELGKELKVRKQIIIEEI